MSLVLNSLNIVEKKRIIRFFSTFFAKNLILTLCDLFARFALILPFMLLISCSANTSRVDSDYCLYVDASSPYYNPNKLTQNQLEECEIRTKKILEIQAIQVEIQKNRTPDPAVAIPSQPLFDIVAPTENEPRRQAARSEPTQAARVVNESIKPIYHTDAGASLVQKNQTVILVSDAAQSSQTLIENQTPRTIHTLTTPTESGKSNTTTVKSTNGLNTLLAHQSSTNSVHELTQNDLRTKALNDAKSISNSSSATVTKQIKTDDTFNEPQKSSDTLLLMQQLKENKLPSTQKTKTNNTNEVLKPQVDDALILPESTPPSKDDNTQPIPTFEPLPSF